MEVTALTCPNCCAQLKLNKSTGMAKCPYCESTFLYKNSKENEPVVEPESHKPVTTVQYNTGQADSGNERIITKQNMVWWILAFLFFPPIALSVLIARTKLPTFAKVCLICGMWFIMCFAFAVAD